MVRTGLERVIAGEDDVLRGKRLALLVNPTSVDGDLRHMVDLLASRADVRCLFGPEHGVRGDAQDMVGVDEARDSQTGLPLHSLYGKDEASLRPRPEQAADLDAVVFDIQDVGARYYTYVWTLLHMMEACAPRGIEVIVLDRPNPINGVDVEGGPIEDACRSFVGRAAIPNRHGMTVGELARWLDAAHGLGCRLHVVPLAGWRRTMDYDETGLPWVTPSPNMPTVDTAFVYPGMCLVEGTELSEGRGTTHPFELVGAPFVSYGEAHDLADALRRLDLPGIAFRAAVFTPQFQKFGGRRCGGIQLHVRSRRAFRPLLTAIAVLRAFHDAFPDHFHWRTREYEFVHDRPAIDLLAGGAWLREGIDAGVPLEALAATTRPFEARFAAERGPHLLYE